MPTETAYIGVGSNIGDSATIVEQAIEALGRIVDCRLNGRSSLYRSAPLGDIPQDDYINAVARIETELEPLPLLLQLQAIESAFYRQRDEELHWGPRTLDLDIILFGNRHFDDSHLVIPHPQFTARRFVLEPMLEIDGDRYIPGYGQPRLPGCRGSLTGNGKAGGTTMTDRFRYIVIEGPIGVGKTSLAKKLALDLQGELFLERAEDNPFLANFYQNPRQYALSTQLHFPPATRTAGTGISPGGSVQ